VIGEVAARAGLDLRVLTGSMASSQLFAAVPFYEGITLDAIGGRGLRWPAHDSAARLESAPWEPVKLDVPPAAAGTHDGALRLGTFRSLWSSKEVDVSPALRFLRPRQVVELSPSDAERLGVNEGDRVQVGCNGTRVRGPVRLRSAVPLGSVFLAEATVEEPANALTGALVEVQRVAEPAAHEPGTAAVQSTPATEGLAAPLNLPSTS
jgi:NADH-quinone oxidoreductase subunit G